MLLKQLDVYKRQAGDGRHVEVGRKEQLAFFIDGQVSGRGPRGTDRTEPGKVAPLLFKGGNGGVVLVQLFDRVQDPVVSKGHKNRFLNWYFQAGG